MARVTLSLPESLLAEADRLAKRCRASRSGFLQNLIAERVRSERQQAMVRNLAEGYREMAAESRTLSRVFSRLEEEALDSQVGGDDDMDW